MLEYKKPANQDLFYFMFDCILRQYTMRYSIYNNTVI